MPRLRDLGITIGRMPPRPNNAITAVPGVLVGHIVLATDAPLLPGALPLGRLAELMGLHRG